MSSYNHEMVEILQMFSVALVRSWPIVRAVFIVWAVCSVTSSLSQIARNLERVVNRWDLEKEASRTPAKAAAGAAERLD